MMFVVFKEMHFTAFICQKIWDWKVDKNELNFNKRYVKKKKTFLKDAVQIKNVANIIKINQINTK